VGTGAGAAKYRLPEYAGLRRIRMRIADLAVSEEFCSIPDESR